MLHGNTVRPASGYSLMMIIIGDITVLTCYFEVRESRIASAMVPLDKELLSSYVLSVVV